ncbi:MAG: cyclase family protein [Pirellulaceae bacterium]
MFNQPTLTITIDQRSYLVLTDKGTSLAIPQTFGENQPNHFAVPKATRSPVRVGTFVGDMRQGGSVNFDEVRLIPHCNGTHTETVGHIVVEEHFISEQLFHSHGLAVIVSVIPCAATATNEGYDPPLGKSDLVLTAEELERAFAKAAMQQKISKQSVSHLVLRTLPNSQQKLSRKYELTDAVPFFTSEAIRWVVDSGIQHLLVDVPSVDRMLDDGRLHSHCLFFGVESGTRKLMDSVGSSRTITEMVFVPDEISDGFYWINLQIPAWNLDAAPSRPIVYPIREL